MGLPGGRALMVRHARTVGEQRTEEREGLRRAERFPRVSSLTIRYALSMSKEISQRELRNDTAAILREVQAGQTITVTRNGVPVAELRPIRPGRFVPRSALAEAAVRAPRIDAGRFRGDLDAVRDPHVDD